MGEQKELSRRNFMQAAIWGIGGFIGTINLMTTGEHSPVVIPVDETNSILAERILGTSAFGDLMPSGGKLPDATIQISLNWIKAGALEK